MAVRIGFIGTGGIAGFHINNLSKIPDAKIAAVCDVVKEKADAAAAKLGATAYPDFHEMLDREDLQAVYVCLPPFAHGQPELAVLAKGLALFVEKPVAMDFQTLKKVTAAVKRKKAITAVGYQDRYLDIIEKLKKFLEGRRPGLILGYWMGGMPGVMWWRQRKLSGGQHVEQTTHIFDMARYLFGEVKRVSAVASTGLMAEVEKYDIEDCSAVNLEFHSGLVGTIFSACCLQTGGRCGIDIFGRDYTVEYKERTSIKITHGPITEETRVANDYGLKEDQVFVEAVKNGDGSAIRAPYEEGAKSAALSLAASESLATGKFIDL
ncbi:MAG: Gfo/Idh/MocA family oxidoreductase [Planctomycetes bacterium]|nr:Gfo/Idh/MocA family oxidoreductase [Planctomycetota bacterium]